MQPLLPVEFGGFFLFEGGEISAQTQLRIF